MKEKLRAPIILAETKHGAWTSHAIQRWAERFPELDPDYELMQARTFRGRKLIQLRKACPAHKEKVSVWFNGNYYLLSQSGVVFVMAPPRVVVTVMRLHETNPT